MVIEQPIGRSFLLAEEMERFRAAARNGSLHIEDLVAQRRGGARHEDIGLGDGQHLSSIGPTGGDQQLALICSRSNSNCSADNTGGDQLRWHHSVRHLRHCRNRRRRCPGRCLRLHRRRKTTKNARTRPVLAQEGARGSVLQAARESRHPTPPTPRL